MKPRHAFEIGCAYGLVTGILISLLVFSFFKVIEHSRPQKANSPTIPSSAASAETGRQP